MFSMIGLLSFMTACAGVPEPYPAPANPFLSGATTLEKASLSNPTKVGLVWLAPAGSKFPSEAAQRALAEKIKTKLSTGTRLEIVGAATVAAPAGDVLSEVRKAAASFNVPQVLVVMPEGTEVVSPVWLQYGRNGSAVGTRTDSYANLAFEEMTKEDARWMATHEQPYLTRPDQRVHLSGRSVVPPRRGSDRRPGASRQRSDL
jgi:hypothetical protein